MLDWPILFAIILFVLCLVLITCIYRLKKTLRQQQNQQRNLHAITSNLSHTWKQPLNRLGLMLIRINQASEYDEHIRKTILDITEEADDTLQFLAETLNAFNRSMVDNQAEENFAPADVVTDAVLLLQNNLKRSRIEINTDLDPHVSIRNNKIDLFHALVSILLSLRDAFSSQETTNPLITITLNKSGTLCLASNVDIHSSPSLPTLTALVEARRLIEKTLAGSIVIRKNGLKTFVDISFDNKH